MYLGRCCIFIQNQNNFGKDIKLNITVRSFRCNKSHKLLTNQECKKIKSCNIFFENEKVSLKKLRSKSFKRLVKQIRKRIIKSKNSNDLMNVDSKYLDVAAPPLADACVLFKIFN